MVVFNPYSSSSSVGGQNGNDLCLIFCSVYVCGVLCWWLVGMVVWLQSASNCLEVELCWDKVKVKRREKLSCIIGAHAKRQLCHIETSRARACKSYTASPCGL